MTRCCLVLLVVLVAALVVRDAEAQKAGTAIEEVDALKMEKAALDVQLAQTQMQVLEKTLTNLQWEAADVRRRLEAATRARDEEIARLAKKAGVDPALCKPDVTARTWVCRQP